MAGARRAQAAERLAGELGQRGEELGLLEHPLDAPRARLDVADLTALPRGRIIVFASGARATLGRSLPWMDSDHADAVRASIRRFDPVAEHTIATAGADPDVVEAPHGFPRPAPGDVQVFDAQPGLGEDSAWRTLA